MICNGTSFVLKKRGRKPTMVKVIKKDTGVFIEGTLSSKVGKLAKYIIMVNRFNVMEDCEWEGDVAFNLRPGRVENNDYIIEVRKC